MIDLESLFVQIQQRFNAQGAQDVAAVFQYNLSDQQAFSCTVENNQCVLKQGAHAQPDIELSLDSELLVAIVLGEADPLQAFMEGKIMAQGNLALAPLLGNLFSNVQQ